jgi:hypothetical protein
MASPRSVKLLKLLKYQPAGLRLTELVRGLGESGRCAESATMTMLLALQDKGRVLYAPRASGATERGGIYSITALGQEYLAGKLEGHPDWAEEIGEGEIETGAMRGEYRTVVVRSAAEVCEPPVIHLPNWVFALAQQDGLAAARPPQE